MRIAWLATVGSRGAGVVAVSGERRHIFGIDTFWVGSPGCRVSLLIGL